MIDSRMLWLAAGTAAAVMVVACLIVAGEAHAQNGNEGPAASIETDSQQTTPAGESASTTPSQSQDAPQAESGLEFEKLRNKRKDTLNAIDDATSHLTTLPGEISAKEKELASVNEEFLDLPEEPNLDEYKSEKERLEARLLDARKDLQQAEQAVPREEGLIDNIKEYISDKETEISMMQRRIDNFKSDKDDFEKQTRELEEKKAAIVVKLDELKLLNQRERDMLVEHNRDLEDIDDEINRLFLERDRSDSFKLSMSMAFTALVSLVIIGFFIIAIRDEEIRKKIFSNDSGIQFITLFSLVIAIILFGIIDILEGRELAALLGGLSGYILGRGTGAVTGRV